MNEKIRKYINDLFNNVQITKRINDLKEELIANANEKYNDLIKDGKSEEVAFENVVSGIGDINELIAELSINNSKEYAKDMNKERKKTGIMVSVAIAIYILSIISLIVTSELGVPDVVSVSIFLLSAGFATCILVYHFISRPDYNKEDTTVVEEFKEWKYNNSQSKAIRDSIYSILWTTITIVYLIISFTFGIWYISWIIFVIGGLISNIIDLLFRIKE